MSGITPKEQSEYERQRAGLELRLEQFAKDLAKANLVLSKKLAVISKQANLANQKPRPKKRKRGVTKTSKSKRR